MIPQLEVCTFNISDLKKTIKYNVSRIELCINKDVGGLTPSKKDIEFAVETNMPIHPIIRPRGGDFLYNNQEMKSMINSISFCREMGCKGIVIGVLDKKNDIDIQKCNELIKYAYGMSLTFHMAFDQVDNPFESMEQIIDLGFDRILTAGKKNSAIEGIDLINELALKGEKRISIMPGSKLRASNIDRFLEKKSILIDLDIRPKDFAGKDNCVYSLNWIINCNADKVLKLRNSLHVLNNLSNKEIISKNDHLLFINNYKDLCRIDFIIKNNIKDKFHHL